MRSQKCAICVSIVSKSIISFHFDARSIAFNRHRSLYNASECTKRHCSLTCRVPDKHDDVATNQVPGTSWSSSRRCRTRTVAVSLHGTIHSDVCRIAYNDVSSDHRTRQSRQISSTVARKQCDRNPQCIC